MECSAAPSGARQPAAPAEPRWPPHDAAGAIHNNNSAPGPAAGARPPPPAVDRRLGSAELQPRHPQWPHPSASCPSRLRGPASPAKVSPAFSRYYSDVLPEGGGFEPVGCTPAPRAAAALPVAPRKAAAAAAPAAAPPGGSPARPAPPPGEPPGSAARPPRAAGAPHPASCPPGPPRRPRPVLRPRTRRTLNLAAPGEGAAPGAAGEAAGEALCGVSRKRFEVAELVSPPGVRKSSRVEDGEAAGILARLNI